MGRNSHSYGTARARHLAYDAVMKLWDRRRREGLTQADLALAMGCSPAWLSRTLRGPGNWTLKTVGAFSSALDGEVEISVHALEDPITPAPNYDAYSGYFTPGYLPSQFPQQAVSKSASAVAQSSQSSLVDAPFRRIFAGAF